MAKLYRKRPVTIEALQFLPDENIAEVIDFLIEGNVTHVVTRAGIVIPTLEGDMLAAPGDYIIRGVKREYYPCKPDIFEATYESLV